MLFEGKPVRTFIHDTPYDPILRTYSLDRILVENMLDVSIIQFSSKAESLGSLIGLAKSLMQSVHTIQTVSR